MKHSFHLAWLLALTACARPPEEAPAARAAEAGALTLTGSSTIAPLANELGKRFEALHPGVRVDVQTGGSSRGINDARAGLADVGMCSRALKPEENDLLALTIARDGIGVIVHADNPVAELTDEQVVRIYTDQVNDWQEVGGAAGAITVVNKAEGRSTLELFLHYYGLAPEQVVADVVIGDNEQGIKTVVGNPQAIGYVSIGTAENAIGAGEKLRLLPVGGVEATTENVRNETFPLSRQLNLVVKDEPTGLVKELLDYACSPAVDDLITGLYFVPPQR